MLVGDLKTALLTLINFFIGNYDHIVGTQITQKSSFTVNLNQATLSYTLVPVLTIMCFKIIEYRLNYRNSPKKKEETE